MSQIDVSAELDRFRRRLLDLSNHNRLLNYKRTRRSTLQIEDELPNQIFARLITESKPFSFEPRPEPAANEVAADQANPEVTELPEHPSPDSKLRSSHTDERLQTNLDQDSLERTLQNIRTHANAAIEDTGVNHLYMALGTLEWYEDECSNVPHYAPLILVPVKLERPFDAASNKYCYLLHYTGVELQPNLSLNKRIEQDFGLRIPEYEGEAEPEAYFKEVQQAIESIPRWRVVREALIGFFSFRKLLMYMDLDPSSWNNGNTIGEHPLIRKVFEGEQLAEATSSFLDDYDIDTHPDVDSLPLADDADSSQHSALCDIAGGEHMVIEGPPGTGKSQTITNAIAIALNQRKKVLFVSEKLAALQVVHNNLQRLGLADLCLELHSEAVQPSVIYESLRHSLDRRHNEPADRDRLNARRNSAREHLRSYLNACSRPVGPHNEPVYELFWRVNNLRTSNVPLLRQANIDIDISEEAFDERRSALAEIGTLIEQIGTPRRHPWYGFRCRRIRSADLDAVSDILERLTEAAGDLTHYAASLSDIASGDRAEWVVWSCEAPRDSLRVLQARPSQLSPTLCRNLIRSKSWRKATELLDRLQDYRQRRSQLRQYTYEEPRSIVATAERLTTDLHTFATNGLVDLTRAELTESLPGIENLNHAADSLLEACHTLDALGYGRVRTLSDCRDACHQYQLLSHREAPEGTNELWPESFLESTERRFNRAKQISDELSSIRSQLTETFALSDAPDPDSLREIRQTLRLHGSNWFRLLSGDYKQSKKETKRFLRSRLFRVGHVITELENLDSYLRDHIKFATDSRFTRQLGPLFQGLDTDWEKLGNLLRWAKTAKQRGLGYQDSARLIEIAQVDHSDRLPAEDVSDRLRSFEQELNSDAVVRVLGSAEKLTRMRIDAIKANITGWTAILRRVQEDLRSFSVGGETTLSQINELARDIIELDQSGSRIEADEEYAIQLGDDFAGPDTDADMVSASMEWVSALRQVGLSLNTLDVIVADQQGEWTRRFCEEANELRATAQQWHTTRDELQQYGELDDEWLQSPITMSMDQSDDSYISVIDDIKRRIHELPLWASYCRMTKRVDRLGLTDIVTATEYGEVSAAQLQPAYERLIYERHAERAIDTDPVLTEFSRQQMEQARERFQQLDQEVIRLNRQQVLARALEEEPPVGTSTGRVRDYTDLGLIRHEINKQKRHCRLRRLIERAGQAVQALRPCFMMSPLSVSQYLSPNAVEFDLVIMDEASQIKPEDALGAIARAKQLVVVGDPKQLPPTNFFEKIGQNVEDEEATAIDDTESILEVAMKAFTNQRRLKWHYRSEHESLIAFSNEKFYEGELVVFPSPTSACRRLGVYGHRVESGCFTGGCNPIEAEAVAAAIARHAREAPAESLGVGTFNAAQRDAIMEQLDKHCENDRNVRKAVDALKERQDGLFIKNLENLQGDERDVIFISYTYGPDPATGMVANRFGPISGSNGWRRLNVLVTRARRRVEVFSSMAPSDIHRTNSLGVASMRDYLVYALNGEMPEQGARTSREPDSPFEVAVARVVRAMGMEVEPQVGVAGYFIDLAVLHPNREDEFLLGIECDGATYHSAKSARDRDRLREKIIRSRGWKIHRIWSTDWFMNQESEKERLQEQIKRLLSEERG